MLPTCVKIINNGGSAGVRGAVKLIDSICKDLKIKGVKVVYFLPDNILDLVQGVDPLIVETGEPVSALGDKPLERRRPTRVHR